MKKILSVLLVSLLLVACGSSSKEFDQGKSISLVSREDGSGTRGAFVELLKIEEKDADGNKKDLTSPEAIIANKTDVMLSNIANDMYAIGYLSLGSLNDTIKALEIDGVVPSVENIVSGDYKVARPFNIAKSSSDHELTNDFVGYILSKDGQKVVENTGYIAIESDYNYESKALSGKVVVAGSSSVSPVMEKLAEAYKAINANAEIEIQTSDSTAGVQAAIDATANIGMASRDLKDEEKAVLEPIVIAIDGIVVVVNNENPVKGLSSDTVKDIFTGTISSWEKLGE